MISLSPYFVFQENIDILSYAEQLLLLSCLCSPRGWVQSLAVKTNVVSMVTSPASLRFFIQPSSDWLRVKKSAEIEVKVEIILTLSAVLGGNFKR